MDALLRTLVQNVPTHFDGSLKSNAMSGHNRNLVLMSPLLIYFSVLESADCRYHQILHLPSNRDVIEIIGDNVEALHDQLLQTANQHGYSVSTQNMQISRSGKPELSNWIDIWWGSHMTDKSILTVDDLQVSVIDGVLRAKDLGTGKNQIFAMTTAHSFLEEEDTDKLFNSTEHYDKVLEEVAARYKAKRCFVEKKQASIKVTGNPRFLFKYWNRKHNRGEWSAVQDIALFEVDSSQDCVQRLLSIENGTNSIWQEIKAHPPILDISSEDELDEYIGKRIMCNGKLGELCFAPDIVDGDYAFGTHLAFTLEHGQTYVNVFTFVFHLIKKNFCNEQTAIML